MCSGHALIRLYEGGLWFMGCIYCPHRIPEGGPPLPAVETVSLPDDPVIPEEVRTAA